jgi:integrase
MARKPQVNYFKKRKAYYTQVNGKQHRLATGPDDAPNGPTYLEAVKAFGRLLEMGNVHRAGGGNKVGVILAKYLQHLEGARKPATVKIRKRDFAAFGARYGELAVADLKPSHLDEFLATVRGKRPRDPGKPGRNQWSWGPGAVRIFLSSIGAALNWAAKRKLIPENPVRGYEMPGPRSRSRECLITPAQHEELCLRSSRNLRDVLVCLEGTGARPGELIHATAQDWNEAEGALVHYPDSTRQAGEFAHKTSRDKERVILFTGKALETMRRLVRQHPTGPLFRTRSGNAWTNTTLWGQVAEIRDAVGNPHITP